MKNMFLFLTLLVVLTTNSNASCFIQDINGNCLQKNQNEISQPGQQAQGGTNNQAINQLTNDEKEAIDKLFRGEEPKTSLVQDNEAIAESGSDVVFSSMVYESRGDYYKYANNFNQALLDYKKAMEINPNSSLLYQGRGEIYFLKGYYNQAIADFTKSIEVIPFTKILNGELMDQEASTFIYQFRGIAYYVEGDHAKAINDFNKVIQTLPDDIYCYYFRGRAYDHLGKHDQALSDYNTAIEKEREFNNKINDKSEINLDIENMVNSLGDSR